MFLPPFEKRLNTVLKKNEQRYFVKRVNLCICEHLHMYFPSKKHFQSCPFWRRRRTVEDILGGLSWVHQGKREREKEKPPTDRRETERAITTIVGGEKDIKLDPPPHPHPHPWGRPRLGTDTTSPFSHYPRQKHLGLAFQWEWSVYVPAHKRRVNVCPHFLLDFLGNDRGRRITWRQRKKCSQVFSREEEGKKLFLCPPNFFMSLPPKRRKRTMDGIFNFDAFFKSSLFPNFGLQQQNKNTTTSVF